MQHLLMTVAAAAMIAVAGHCLLQIVRMARSHRRGLAQEVVHVAMALTMAAMFLGLLSGTAGAIALVAFVLVGVWLAAEVVLRGGSASARLCVSSLAMAVMAWAMTRPTRGGSAGQMSSMPGMSMPGMSMPGAGAASGGLGTVGLALVWLGLAAMLALAAWSVRRRRTREAVMGGAMVLMFGSML